MKNNNMRRSTFSIILPIGLLVLIFSQWQSDDALFDNKQGISTEKKSLEVVLTKEEKQKGAHVFGPIDSSNRAYLHQHNFEWITLVAWGDQEAYNSPELKHHYGDSLDILKSDSIWVARVKSIRAAGFKVFVKPHVWIRAPATGKWRSDLFPENEENWKLWKKSYRDFILRYAQIAEEGQAEMFCIGTELSQLTVHKSAFWEALIQEVRQVYSGKITYAANWYNEFEKISFWDQLDFIGIQAYFPVAKNNYPTVEQVSKGWDKHIPAIESIHKKYKRKILFTEMGYRSIANAAMKPWEWIQHGSNQDSLFSLETQANCYEGFFKTIWNKKWFAGVHLWQLRGDYKDNQTIKDLDFGPQGKPAAAIIARAFDLP